MVSVASRAHRAATSLLLQTDRALARDFIDEAEVAATLREAFSQYARAYLAERTLFGGEDADSDRTISQWFDLAPHALASKGTTLLRKLNYLAHASPYRPMGQDDAEWDAESVRDELATVVGEIRALLATETRDRPLPPFRGEGEVCLEPGTVVRYSLFDWGEWTDAVCVVIASRPPTLILRFEDRHYEEVDATIAHVQPVRGLRVDLEEPFEAMRTQFELILAGDDVSLYDHPHLPATLGVGRAVVTCACCGYPTRRMQYPAFLRLPVSAARTERCVLCGWDDGSEAVVDGSDPMPAASAALVQARANVRARAVAFAADDDDAVATSYQDPARRALAARARALFDGVRTADSPRGRAEIWRAAQAVVRSLGTSSSVDSVSVRDRGTPRVTLAVQQAFASL